MTSHFLWASRTMPLHKQGQELRSERTVIPIHEQHNLYLFFCVLTIRKQLPGNDFERSGRGQEPSRGHKFSILENFLSIRDFASQTLASFLSDLVGACLPQPLLRTDEEELCQFDTIPPRISIYAANINLLFLIQLVSE